jgi:hypothetical protein
VDTNKDEAPTLPPTAAVSADVSTPKTPLAEVTEPKVDSQRDTTVAGQQRSEMGTLPGLAPPPPTLIGGNPAADRAPSSARDIDELLAGIEPGEQPDDMQSGTHRKVLTTLIGVAPPPRPNIGGPPPLAIPTNVALVSTAKPALSPPEAVSPGAARDAAGIADLLRTAVPSRRPDTAGSRPVVDAIAPAASAARLPAATQKQEERDPISAALSTEPPPPSSQLERYRRLTIFFGATTVLLLTLLVWMVFDSTPGDRVAAPRAIATVPKPSKAPPPVSSAVTPVASATSHAGASAGQAGQPQVDDESAEAAPSATAETTKKTSSVSKAVPKAPAVPRKPTKKKIFVPDDI